MPVGDVHKQLMQQVAEFRDREAFKSLFQHFAPRVKALMIKSGAASGEAEDIAQDVMMRVWLKSIQYSNAKGAVSTWVYTIARNVRIDRLRRGSSRPYEDIDEIEVASDDAGAEAEVLAMQQAKHVNRALATLPNEQKTDYRNGLSAKHDSIGNSRSPVAAAGHYKIPACDWPIKN